MAANTFTLQVVTVTDALFDGDAQALTCRNENGQMTVLPHHEPFITRLVAGELVVRDDAGRAQSFTIQGGVLEVADNKAVVLCTHE